jgi:hypothetical protein
LFTTPPARGRFVSDADAKRREVSPRTRELVERWVQAPYERLERTRTGS